MDVNNTTQDNSPFTLLPPIFTSTNPRPNFTTPTTPPIPNSTTPHFPTTIEPLGITRTTSHIYTSIFTSGSHHLTDILTGSPDLTNILSGSSNYTNSTSGSSNYTNGTFSYNDDTKGGFITGVVTYIIICINLPLTLIAIYSLYSLVRNDHVVPIYVINLLICDLIQLCCVICDAVEPDGPIIYIIYSNIYYYSLMTSVGFMVCIALERYLLIVFPLWYHCRRTIKSTVVICVVAWAIPCVYLFTVFFAGNFNVPQIIALVFLFLPFPLLTFFCCATLKALSASVSILPEEKRRIVGTLVLVLLIYMLLFLPNIILIVVVRYIKDPSLENTLYYLAMVFVRLNPLADLILYIFMKKGALDKILASVCCCRVKDQDVSSLENNTNGVN